ncbi:hypothetical protein KSX_94340 [Ktedonospora formicarum]|uniref:Uncharacterized protein n=2 Tax=Ktedonospora formicarum TaxID=2778364 RepID=A0A8J3IC43_9CHLR|nr:hypothetical protein KSX_94340 [Ktedonospora formicarum]
MKEPSCKRQESNTCYEESSAKELDVKPKPSTCLKVAKALNTKNVVRSEASKKGDKSDKSIKDHFEAEVNDKRSSEMRASHKGKSSCLFVAEKYIIRALLVSMS